jgi:peptidoglycan/xylan/chitin deacetylase (PgdA/CDA1 family)
MINKIKSAVNKYIGQQLYNFKLHQRLLKGKALILMYHRIMKENDARKIWLQPGMYVTPNTLEMHLKFLKKYFKLISLNELISKWNNDCYRNDQTVCCITMDDGWIDNYNNAFPILKRHNVEATIFIPTSFVGTEEWFWSDRLQYLFRMSYLNKYVKGTKILLSEFGIRYDSNVISKEMFKIISHKAIEKVKMIHPNQINGFVKNLTNKLGIFIPIERMFLNWEEIEVMSNNKISFGSHTHNHKILKYCTENEIREELSQSYKIGNRNTINFVPIFCYPNGICTTFIENIVRNSAYRAAVTTKLGIENMSKINYFKIKRIGLHEDVCSSHQLLTNRLIRAVSRDLIFIR